MTRGTIEAFAADREHHAPVEIVVHEVRCDYNGLT